MHLSAAVQLAELFAAALSAEKPWPTLLELDLNNTPQSRELQLHYKDERERAVITELHAKAQDVINQVNDFSMELLRVHFQNSLGETKSLCELATGFARLPDKDREEAPRETQVLVKMHEALASSCEPGGPVQSFYPLTSEEKDQLACAVRYVQHATDFVTAQSGLFMWMHSMSLFAHSVAHRWEKERERDMAEHQAVMMELQRLLALEMLNQLLIEQVPEGWSPKERAAGEGELGGGIEPGTREAR